jgi:diacylglycerol kinase (ATP)
MYYFIVNPVAGGGRCAKIMSALAKTLEARKIEHEIVMTKYTGHAEELAAEASAAGCGTVVAVGGDGTVMETAAGLLKSGGKTALGIIPGGSGNDYRHSLGIPMDAEGALGIVLDGENRQVDAGLFNGKPFFNIGSVGFDVSVVEARMRLKSLGSLAYYAGVFTTLARYKCKKMRLWINDALQEKEILITAIGNGLFYGGGMKVLPDALPGDGSFDVCVIDSIPRLKIATLFPQFPSGGHTKFPFVKFYRCEKVVIDSYGEPFSVQTDGELHKDVTSAEFSILPGALRVMAPAT